ATEDLVQLAGSDLTCDFTVAPASETAPASAFGRLIVHVTNADDSVATDATVCGDGLLSFDMRLWHSGGALPSFVLRAGSEITVVAVAPGRCAHRRVTVPSGQTEEVTLQL